MTTTDGDCMEETDPTHADRNHVHRIVLENEPISRDDLLSESAIKSETALAALRDLLATGYLTANNGKYETAQHRESDS